LEQPIADNATPEGRQKNRRVQFKIVEKANRDKSEVNP
jgi:outer membrane protein OmpA-like peptidoglycan-associated protein